MSLANRDHGNAENKKKNCGFGKKLLLLIFILLTLCTSRASEFSKANSSLYQHRVYRDTGACKRIKYEYLIHSKFKAAHFDSEQTAPVPLVETRYRLVDVGERYWEKRPITVLHQIVSSPLNTLSILEPGHSGSCTSDLDGRTLVRETAVNNQCFVAINAGLFNTHTGACLGNIVSDGIFVQNSGGIQNAHFGLTKGGEIFVGYLSELDLLTEDFTQLVGGVIWLVKNGTNYVEESMKLECPDTQETGSLDRFVTVVSARTAIGHDAQGRVHLIEVNGKTDQRGINLNDLADLLVEMGIINAINLDGGGSATVVVNGTLVNYPSDKCVNSSDNCERPVTTIVCIHAPYCTPKDCNNHGSCNNGVCQCQGLWSGSGCDKLKCPDDCNLHGICTEDGCECHSGWKRSNCSNSCEDGFYGPNCALPCLCENDAACNVTTGDCDCKPGFYGNFCQRACPIGYYGKDCLEICFCEDSCFCDPVSGNCSEPEQIDTEYMTAGQCIAEQRIKQENLIPSTEDQTGLYLTTVICLSVLGVSSLFLNALLTYAYVKSRHSQKTEIKREVRLGVKRAMRKAVKGNHRHNSENDDEDDDVDEEDGHIDLDKNNQQFWTIPDNASTSTIQTPNTAEYIRVSPTKQKDKTFNLKKLWPRKGVRVKEKPWSPTRNESRNVGGKLTDQYVPLLGRKSNGGEKIERQDILHSSEESQEELFTAPQNSSGQLSGSR